MSAPAAHPRTDPLLLTTAIVAVGGTLGTGLRLALSLAFPPVAGVPVTTAVINIAGAFALGLLIAALLGTGPESRMRRRLRLGLGTGLLGGFTTYSALAADALLLGRDAAWLGIAYALGTVLLGLAASLAGLAAGSRLRSVGTARGAGSDTAGSGGAA